MKVSSVASHSQQESPSHLVTGEGESLHCQIEDGRLKISHRQTEDESPTD